MMEEQGDNDAHVEPYSIDLPKNTFIQLYGIKIFIKQHLIRDDNLFYFA